MKTIFLKLTVGLLFLFSVISMYGQGVTTSGINGRITEPDGESLPGATIIALHEPTGTQFAGVTNEVGLFNIPNMDIGGPYTITISFVGYEDFIQKNVYLTLGQTFEIKKSLSTETQKIDEVVVSASLIGKKDIFDGNRTGAETVISSDELEILPTLDRRLADYARLSPQATVNSGGISFAGQNNRYNSIMIDGAVNNDAFGLSSSGTNGGQTGLSPISMDAIEQVQIVLAPYDVRQSGFTGGGINAVTRRGTNTISGSVYSYYRNENFAGKTPIDGPDSLKKKLDPFTSQTSGIRLGGPIIKNKLFLFGSYERVDKETPQPFDFQNSEYRGNASYEQLTNDIPDKLANEMGYTTGGFEANTQTRVSDKLLFRLDWNINTQNRLMLRHSYTKNVATLPNSSSSSKINYYNNGVYFPSTSNVTALELKSNYNTWSNSLMITYTDVLDDRDPINQDFPSIRIDDGDAADIYFGSEPYSTANQLQQKIFTVADNFIMYKGKHTITIGTHNEFGQVYNLFVRRAFGEYRYSSVDDFLNDSISNKFRRSYSLVDDISGDGSKAAAEFGMAQLGFYVQDEWQVRNNFKLTYGLRIDVPVFLDDPMAIEGFDTTLSKIEEAGVNTHGAQSGKMPDTQILWSPRIGFNWDVYNDKTLQVRGGLGLFASRLPWVWPGGAYTNNGQTVGNYTGDNTYRLIDNYDPYNQPPIPEPASEVGGQIDLYAKDFKFPQVFRTSAAIDQKLPGGLVGTLEGIFTKTINNGIYYNINVAPSEKNMTGNGNDNRLLYDGDNSKIEEAYDHIIVGSNTNKGYSYNITTQVQKPLTRGFSGSIAYNFGRSMVMNDNLSSQNVSQWRKMQTINGRNDLDLSVSTFDVGHRIMANIAYQIEYGEFGRTTVTLYYNGQSGDVYNYVYTEGIIGDDIEYTESDLIYVPASRSEIELVDMVDDDNNLIATADEQWADLEAYINNDDYLKERKGQYAERNKARTPFTHIIDLKIVQDFFFKTGDYTHTLQLTFDIFNFTNMLNSDWGRTHWVEDGNYGLITPVGFANGGTTMQYNFDKPGGDPYEIDDIGINSSRWHAQIGIRYLF
jgi:outer membrane receptor for ferrienterochelin and colicin